MEWTDFKDRYELEVKTVRELLDLLHDLRHAKVVEIMGKTEDLLSDELMSLYNSIEHVRRFINK